MSCKTEFLVVVCMKVTLSRRLFTFQENFLEELLKKCKFTTENIVAVVSNTAISMNKFGTLLEKLDIPHIYCTDYVLQIIENNSYLYSWCNGAVSVVSNDAEDLYMDEVVELSTIAKVRSFVE